MVDTEPRGGTRDGVSRRAFVKAAGASGIAVGLAGCTGGGGGDGGGSAATTTPIDTAAPSEEVTVQWAADSNFKNAEDQIVQSLRNAGLPDNINIEILGGSFVTDDRRTKYKNILEAGQKQPSILMMDNGWMLPFVARGQLQNLSKSLPSEMTSKVKDSYFEASVGTAQGPNGDLFGIPLFADFPTMQYRKDLVEAAGYDPDGENWATEPLTWQRFSQVTKDVADQNDMNGFTFQASPYEGLACCDFNEFMSSWGGAYFGGRDNLFGPVGERPITVDEQAVVDSIRMVQTFIHGSDAPSPLEGYAGEIAPQAVVQYKEESSRKPFTNGDVVMHRNWPYSITINGASDAFGEDLGVMPLPYAAEEGTNYEGVGGTTSALGGWHLALNPNSTDTQKSAALQVLKYLMTDQVMLDMFEIGGWIPPRPELVATEETRQLDVIGRYVDTLKVAGENAMPRPVTVVWPQESQQISKEVNSAYRLEKSPDKAMTDLKAALEQIESSA